MNEIGESILSIANSVIFANVPSEPLTLSLEATAMPASIKAEWTAPASVNGDAVSGYRVYVDDGAGGPFTMVYDGHTSSTYSFEIPSLTCGLLYFVQVSAKNSAGEGHTTHAQIWLGEVPSEPLNPVLLSILPDDNLVLGWDAPTSDGCLTILSYTLSKDGLDHVLNIAPSMVSYQDDISVSGSIGDVITYKLKAVNQAGESQFSE